MKNSRGKPLWTVEVHNGKKWVAVAECWTYEDAERLKKKVKKDYPIQVRTGWKGKKK